MNFGLLERMPDVRTLIAITLFVISLSCLALEATAQTTQLSVLETGVLDIGVTVEANIFDSTVTAEFPLPFISSNIRWNLGLAGLSFAQLQEEDDDEDPLTTCFNNHPEPVQKDGETDKVYNARRQQWKNDIRSCMNQHPPRESDGYVPPTGGPVKSGGGWKDKDGKIWKPWNPATHHTGTRRNQMVMTMKISIRIQPFRRKFTTIAMVELLCRQPRHSYEPVNSRIR